MWNLIVSQLTPERLNSLFRGALKWAGGFLLAHHMTKSGSVIDANAESIIGLGTTIAGFVLSHQWHGPSASSSGGTVSSILFAFAVLIAPLGLTGCNLFGGSKNLEAGGAYAPASFQVVTNSSGIVSTNITALAAPDPAFYAVDASFDLAMTTIDGLFKWERNNRAFLWKISPSIKHSLDAIRPQAWSAITLYTSARQGYMASPTPDGLSTMQMLLSKLQALESAAQQAANSAATNSTH
jgi:hypothetical protein